MGSITLGGLNLGDHATHAASVYAVDLGTPDPASNRRAMQFVVHYGGGDTDSVIANIRAVQDVLRKAAQAARAIPYGTPQTIVLQPGTNPVTFDLLADVNGNCGYFNLTPAGYTLLRKGRALSVPLTVITSAYGRGERLTATNLILNSTDPTASGWTATNLTVTANAATGPNGATVAATLRETTTNGVHSLSHQITKAASALDYAFPVYLQAAGRTYVDLTLQASGGSNGVVVGLNLCWGRGHELRRNAVRFGLHGGGRRDRHRCQRRHVVSLLARGDLQHGYYPAGHRQPAQ